MTYYSDLMLPKIREMMEQGKTPIQVAAALKVSKRQLVEWLENPDPKYNKLRDEFELGMTNSEAFWEEKAQKAIMGAAVGFKEGTYKLFMQNRFKWTEKVESSEKSSRKSPAQLIPDDVLEEQIRKQLEKHSNGSIVRSEATPSREGEKDSS